MSDSVRILYAGFVTHDVKQLIVTRPEGLEYEPGQGVEIALDADGWRDEGRPFTPTGPKDGPVLEFTIKAYPERDGVTEKLHDLKPGAGLLMSGPFGTITDRGPGVFIAGGAGVTPFLAILRHMDAAARGNSTLLFTNRTPADVICEKELRFLLGERCHLTCTERSGPAYESSRIDASYLRGKIDDLEQPFYVCGPPDFVEDVSDALTGMGVEAERIIVEE